MNSDTLLEYFGRVYAREHSLAPSTAILYRNVIRRFVRHCGGEDVRMKDVAAKLAGWLESLETGGTDLVTLYNYERIIRGIHDYRRGEQKKPIKVKLRRTTAAVAPEPDEPPDIFLSDFFESQYRPIRMAGTSLHGRRLHLVSIRNFERFLGRVPTLADLTDDNLSRFLAWHLDVRRNSRFTANRDGSRLLAVWRFACRRGLLKVWPEITKLPEPKRMPEAWSLGQYGQILAACQQVMGRICGIPGRLWWTALHLTIYDSAERIGAVMSVPWSDVDLDGAWFLVRAEYRKGGKSDRVYRLRPETIAALRAMRTANRSGPIFPWDRDPTTLWHRYKQILRAAGLPHDRRSMFHRLRRTVASHFKLAGGDATALLDHTSAKVTNESYLDPRIVGQQHAADLLPAIEVPHVPDPCPLETVIFKYCEEADHGRAAKHWSNVRSSLRQTMRRAGAAKLEELNADRLLAAINGPEARPLGGGLQQQYYLLKYVYQFLAWMAGRSALPDGLLEKIEAAFDELRDKHLQSRRKDGAA